MRTILMALGVAAALGMAAALPACGATSEPAAVVHADVGAGDGAGDVASGLDGFCVGLAPKLQLGAALSQPAAVSSAELVMDCCEGVLLRFHAAAWPTGRLEVMIRGMGGMIASGEHDLAKLPAGLEVRLGDDATPLGEGLTGALVGRVRVDSAANPSEPYAASLCAEVQAPGKAWHGLRLYLRDFPVARWGWHARLAVKRLADPSITAQAALQQPLASLTLDPEPLLGLGHIGWYTQGHAVHWGMLMGKQALLNRVGPVGTQGVPFVVEADGQRVYLGAFYSLVSSQSFAGPTILVEGVDDSGFAIAPAYAATPSTADPRSDPRILKVLSEAGKLVP